MNRLIELKKHRGVKLGINVVPSEFKREIRIKYGICGAQHCLSSEAFLKETGWNSNWLVSSHIYEINESHAFYYSAVEIAFVWVEIVTQHLLANAWVLEKANRSFAFCDSARCTSGWFLLVNGELIYEFVNHSFRLEFLNDSILV